MSARAAAAAIGAVFGVTLSWTGLVSPEVIRAGLLFESAYLILVFAAALTTAFAGLALLRRRAPRAPLTGERVEWETLRPERRHVVGGVLFGTGWALAGACPGPIAAQVGQGIAWGVPTMVGLVAGLVLVRRLQARPRGAAPGRAARAPVIPSPAAADAAG